MTHRCGKSPPHNVVRPKGVPVGDDDVECATSQSEVCVSPTLVGEPDSGFAPGGKNAPTSDAEVRRGVCFRDDGAKDAISGESALAPLGEEETFMEARDRVSAEEAAEPAIPIRERAQDDEDEVFRDEDGAICFEGQNGEERKIKIPTVPVPPSREQVRRHRLTHCPFRPWCALCVSGAANMPGHFARASPLSEVPELHSDYGFFRDRKGDKVNSVTVLITKDRKSQGVCAHFGPKKGVGGGFIVKQYDRDIKKFGYRSKVTLRSDGEPAIRDLLDKVSNMRASETVTEHTPKGDSKANGRAERAVQSIEKQTRVLKSATEEHVGRFGVIHPAFTWMVMHSADVLTKCLVLSDGQTAYEKIKGREYTGQMLEFGMVVLHNVRVKAQGGIMEPRWGFAGSGWVRGSRRRNT